MTVAMATAARNWGRSWVEMNRISLASTTTKRASATTRRRAGD